MSVVIELSGLELYGYHGALEREHREGQRFLVDVELEPSSVAAAVSDDIADAVDYRLAVEAVRQAFEETRYQLLEALAAAIAARLVRDLPVRRVRVRVRKPDVRLAVPVQHSAVVVEQFSEP
jgi:dihydroneopterin aldolase